MSLLAGTGSREKHMKGFTLLNSRSDPPHGPTATTPTKQTVGRHAGCKTFRITRETSGNSRLTIFSQNTKTRRKIKRSYGLRSTSLQILIMWRLLCWTGPSLVHSLSPFPFSMTRSVNKRTFCFLGKQKTTTSGIPRLSRIVCLTQRKRFVFSFFLCMFAYSIL